MKILELNTENLNKYQEISIAFTSDTVLDFEAIDNGLGGFKVIERKVEPFKKDYDDDGDVSSSIINFDLSNWKMIAIEEDNKFIAGAIIAFNTKGINLLRGRDDLFVVWDIRINENYRYQGLGTKIFDYIKKIAKENGVNEIQIETQNNNVNACRFYKNQGASIIKIDKQAYSDYKDETQIIWSIDL